MGTESGSRRGASGGRRPLPFRLRFGAIEFDLLPNGEVRVVWPVYADYCDLRTFLAAVGARRGT